MTKIILAIIRGAMAVVATTLDVVGIPTLKTLTIMLRGVFSPPILIGNFSTGSNPSNAIMRPKTIAPLDCNTYCQICDVSRLDRFVTNRATFHWLIPTPALRTFSMVTKLA